ncbi:hypothetical protein [Nibrella viscosa]
MPNKKSTSPSVASLAGKTLNDSNASAIAKKFAASALSQVQKGNQTGSAMEDAAAKALASNKYSDLTHTLAASILSQSDKNR